ncbi:MAG TPA: glycosyltransferase family 4 protein [Pirellulales bacterium]|jgi:glycosyltransferase involved in cell wall biosynthesis|nr:glycosyltransferase family 4 protein [Pirellulales bacterium]
MTPRIDPTEAAIDLSQRADSHEQATISAARDRIHIWLPDLHFKGGIQVYSTFFLRTLIELFPDQRYTVIVKNDPPDSDAGPLSETVKFRRLGHWPSWLRTPVFAARIAFEALKERPALIVCGHLNFSIAAHWLRRTLGIEYWTIAHGVEAWKIRNPGVQSGVRAADRVLSVSHFTAGRLVQEQRLDPQRISILPNTFNPDDFQVRPKPRPLLTRYGLKPETKVILTVARLDHSERYKGYDRIIRALPEIRQHVPSVHYLLVGKGTDRPRLERLIRQHRVGDHVTLAGFIPDPELPAHYNLCDVFAMPSKKEGFGIVFLEALASGKPVLAGNRDGATDALCNGELGVLVDPDDQAAITRALIEMLQGTHSLEILRSPELLRRRVIEMFSLDQFAQRLKAIWEEHFFGVVPASTPPAETVTVT